MLETSSDQVETEQAATRKETPPLITEIMALLGNVSGQLQSAEHENWRWIAQHSQNPQIIEIIRGSTLMSMRVLNAIGRLEPTNGATIAAQFRIPKGTVSKVTRRLLAQHLITTEFLPHNKKEVHFRLTPQGRDFFEANRAFDEQMEHRLVDFFQRYTPDELGVLIRVLQDASETPILTLGLQEPVEQH